MRLTIWISKLLGVIAALVSAYFWFSASRVVIPALTADGPSNTLNSVGSKLQEQSGLNAHAAVAMFIAVFLLEVLSPILHTISERQRGGLA